MSQWCTAPAVFLSAAALVLGAALVPGTDARAAAPPGQTGPGGPARPAGTEKEAKEKQDRGGKTHTVTLLTGDVVEYTAASEGAVPSLTIEAAPRPGGTDVTFATVPDTDGGYLVLPSDVTRLVAAGTVDDELFDVETLVEEGLADGNQTLPLIVSYSGKTAGAAVPKAAAALPASKPTSTLESINGAAVTVRTDRTERFWADLRGGGAERPGATTLASGVRKVWLDRTIHAWLDQSVRLVGAPTAWNHGLDGSGVTVAVLDTGIDATHPDVAEQVVDSANFTDTAGTADRRGHGTHVASIIAGTGAASDGRYRGVAPGADLLVGKVLDNSGDGSISWMIDGMEWAAGQGADVVNLSLGSPGGDGTGPGSLAVNRLTERYGTLFVAAAGNEDADLAISAPAVADQALAVGAVDKTTGTSPGDFSRGPRLEDAAVKPNIMAPGIGIVAARSSTSRVRPLPGNDRYALGRGTSMASPHVAGAAAILAQQHPDWDATELRDALTSTARHLDHNWFEQGAGGLDIARAVTQKVFATSVVDFHHLEHGGDTAVRQITYRNLGDEPVTLDTTVQTRGWSGEPAPSGAVRIGSGATRETVTVPPDGTATVDLVVDPGAGDIGAYGGWVSAGTSDGKVRLSTPFSYYTGPKTYELDVSMLNSYGTAEFHGQYGPNVLIYVVPLHRPNSPEDPFNPPAWDVLHADDTGQGQITLPAGEYELIGKASDRFIRTRSSWVIETVSLTSNMTVTLDARETVPMRPVLPDPVDGRGSIKYIRTFDDRPSPFTLTTGLPADASAHHGDVYISPLPEPSAGQRRLSQQWAFEPALLAGAVAENDNGVSIDLHPAYDVEDLAERLTGEQAFPVVFGGQGRAEDLDGVDVEGKLVLVAVPRADGEEPYVDGSQNMNEAAERLEERGAAGVIGYLDVPEDGQRLPTCGRCELLRLGLDVVEGRELREALRAEPVSVTLTPRTKVDPVYRLRFDDQGAMPTNPRRVRRRDLARIEAHYHAQQDVQGREYWQTSTGEPAADLQLGARLSLPQGRTEYVGPPRPDLTWTRTIRGQELDLESQDRFLPKRKRRVEHWFKAPLVPGTPEVPRKSPASPLCTMCRDGDRFIPAEYWLDSDQHVSRMGPVWDTVPRLFRDGREIGVEGRRPRSFPVPDGSASYRVEADEETGWTLSEQVNTAWEFTSTPPSKRPDGYRCEFGDSCTVQPAVQLGYDLPLDLRNRTRAGRLFGFTLDAGTDHRAPGRQRVRHVTVEYSVDDGEHWWPGFAWPRGHGEHVVLVAHPPLPVTSGFVSLRVEAEDGDGASTRQTIKRAYALK